MPQVVMAAAALYGAYTANRSAQQQSKAAKSAQKNVLTYDKAMPQAENTMNPVYNQVFEKSMGNLDKQNMSRGFYGQMPGDVLKDSTAAQIRGEQANGIANLANSMVGQSQSYASQLENQALAAQQQKLSALGNLTGTVGDIANNYYNQTGYTLYDLFGGLGTSGQYPTGSTQTFASTPDQQTWAGNYSGSSPSLSAPTTKAYGVDFNNLVNNNNFNTPSMGWNPQPTQLETSLSQWNNPWAN